MYRHAYVYNLIIFANSSFLINSTLHNTHCKQFKYTILYFIITFRSATCTIFDSAFIQDTFIFYDIKLFKNV